jgi:hypothetical protein
MEHNHQDYCKHLNVAYCEECKVVYCKDCGREWYDKCTLNHYRDYTYFPPYTYPSTISTTTQGESLYTYKYKDAC